MPDKEHKRPGHGRAATKEGADQPYLVRVKIGGIDDPETWYPGAIIMLPDDKALAHLAAGNVTPTEDTIVPVVEPIQIEHHPEPDEPDEPPTRAAKAPGPAHSGQLPALGPGEPTAPPKGSTTAERKGG